MKRLSTLLLVFVLLGLTACSGNIGNTPQIFNTESQQLHDTPTAEPTKTVISENSIFAVHFIDVGQGDAALVLCDGKSMLIDGGRPKASDVIYTYLKNQGINCLDYIICSHPDDDHIGGLSAPLSTITVNNVYAPDVEADIKSYQSFKQKTEEQGLIIKHPICGESFQFGTSNVNFLGPVTESEDDKNNSSIVMKITYGETSFLFTGDAEREEEQQILDKGYDLSATVLKVGHHGSRNSTTYPFLREIMPEYAVISVGKDNTYGHPTEDVLSRLLDAGAKVFRTDIQGDIIAVSDGHTVTITPAKNADADTLSAQRDVTTPKTEAKGDTVEAGYIGNSKTKKFHLPSCKTLPAEHNRMYFDTRDNAIQTGYTPCGNCHP